MTAVPIRVCVVGAGPRGLSILERLCANAGAAPVEIHLVDPYPPGPGRVWRTGQSRHLLMNTVASQVSMFTDDSVEMAGPVAPGPSLWEWARALTASPGAGSMPDEFLREAAGLGPDSYPSRALYGHYLGWVLRAVVERAPAGVAVHLHRARVVRLEDSGLDRTQRVYLDDGVIIKHTDAVVLAQGHVPTAPDAAQRELARFARGNGLRYVPPANPADVALGFLAPGQPVLLRGLGLCFFDYLALLTAGRGGVFERHDGRLRYRRGGLEPMIYAGSRRGVPYHARGENQKGAFGRHLPQVLTPELVARLRAAGTRAGGVDFRREVWPLIAREAETVYYATLLGHRLGERAAELFRRMYLALPAGGAEAELLERFDVPSAQRWDWRRVMDPLAGREFADGDAFRGWLLEYLRADVVEARRGNVGSPLKAALDVLRDLRNEVRLLVDHGGLAPRSHLDDLDGWFTPANAFLSIGPPLRRIEEAIALVEAGVLEFVGPRIRVETDAAGGCFAVRSAVPAAEPLRVGTLIEARLGEPDLRRTADPLLRDLLGRGQVRPYRIGGVQLPGLAVTARPNRVVDAADVAHPRRFAFGVPTESVHWATAVGIRPGVGSVILTDSDAIARRVLGLDRGDRPDPYSFVRESTPVGSEGPCR